MHSVTGGRRSTGGFTLVELLVVVAVVAILGAIALPSYSTYVMRSKRADAKTVILQAAQFLERNYTSAGCYNFTLQTACASQSGAAAALPAALAVAPTAAATNPGRTNYKITATLAQQSYSLTATPCGASSASCAGFADPDCGALTLDNAGIKTAAGPSTATACWQR
jgi:type IV pilus assembly protein PilE